MAVTVRGSLDAAPHRRETLAMIDHVIIGVTDVSSAKKFYEAALKPLGYAVGYEGDWGAGFKGSEGALDFWIRSEEKAITPVHVAFQVEDRALVSAFYEAAIAAGGKENGAPGPRPHYHPNYFAAFVLDADGHNIEAVCHKPAD
jgi:catechol 2,3-dioxygenase-like lactoylglutathione lyase family enzyme